MDNKPNNKNFLIALILSMAILFAWQFFITDPKEKEYLEQLEKFNEQTSKIAVQKERAIINRQELIKSGNLTDEEMVEKFILVETPKVKGRINLQGFKIDELKLLSYNVSSDENDEKVQLLSNMKDKIYFAEFGWLSNDKSINLPTGKTIWQSEDKILAINKPIKLYFNNNQGILFEIEVNIDEDYMFSITKTVKNNSGKDIKLSDYGLINRTFDPEGLSADEGENYLIHQGGIGSFNNILEEIDYSDLHDEKKISLEKSNGWLGFTDKYWLTAIIPQQQAFYGNFSYYFPELQNRYQADYLSEPDTIEAGGAISNSVLFFAGAKKVKLLDSYAEKYNIDLFDRAVDFGILYFITKPIFYALNYFNKLTGNFGVAILMLTIMIKMLLYPLAHKSYVSMHHIKKYHPQIIALRERYKDDKVQLNKEIMSLYKQEKINPAAGCLPILLQLPIFFALYKVLFVTIEMRHAPFFGWIQDLSSPDPTSIFNLFGLLDYNVPEFFQLGVWPIIMGITMWVQQRMNPAPADPIQAKIFKLLPFIFTFVLYRFPAGLVIYWAWNNTLTVSQQWFITRKLK